MLTRPSSYRNPAKADVWARDLRCTGVAVHLMTLDVTKMAEVQNLKQKLDATHPPVGGIINGAMLLSDGLFADMTLESLQQVLAPKVTGSQNLSQVYNQPDLDFFIMFSSLTCIGGNSGQSNYTAANLVRLLMLEAFPFLSLVVLLLTWSTVHGCIGSKAPLSGISGLHN
jgi:hybrid polyketide synthase / nonribosomal peptide synthetase ACE1